MLYSADPRSSQWPSTIMVVFSKSAKILLSASASLANASLASSRMKLLSKSKYASLTSPAKRSAILFGATFTGVTTSTGAGRGSATTGLGGGAGRCGSANGGGAGIAAGGGGTDASGVLFLQPGTMTSAAATAHTIQLILILFTPHSYDRLPIRSKNDADAVIRAWLAGILVPHSPGNFRAIV